MNREKWLLERAGRTLESARLLLDQEFVEESLTRSYYALFYCASALLAAQGRVFAKHSAVIAAFGQFFAKTGILDPVHHQRLRTAQNRRLTSDYEQHATFTAEDAREQIGWAEELLKLTTRIVPRVALDVVVLYRPVGQAELELIQASRWTAFPPRLPHQPIFYPVLDQQYATQIARDWNTRDDASGYVGYVLRFSVERQFLEKYTVQTAGTSKHREYWIPAEDLEEFNEHIVGPIEVIDRFP